MMSLLKKKLENEKCHTGIIGILDKFLEFLEKEIENLTKHHIKLGQNFYLAQCYITAITQHNQQINVKQINIKGQKKHWENILGKIENKEWQQRWIKTVLQHFPQFKTAEELINPITLYLFNRKSDEINSAIETIQKELNENIAKNAQNLFCDFLKDLLKNNGKISFTTEEEKSNPLILDTFLSKDKIDDSNKTNYSTLLDKLLANRYLKAEDYIELFDFLQKKIIKTKDLDEPFSKTLKNYCAQVCKYDLDEEKMLENITKFYQRLQTQQCILKLSDGKNDNLLYQYKKSDKGSDEEFIKLFLSYNGIMHKKISNNSTYHDKKHLDPCENYYALEKKLQESNHLQTLYTSIETFCKTKIHKLLMEKSVAFSEKISELSQQSAKQIWGKILKENNDVHTISNIRFIIKYSLTKTTREVFFQPEKLLQNADDFRKLHHLIVTYSEKTTWTIEDYQSFINFYIQNVEKATWTIEDYQSIINFFIQNVEKAKWTTENYQSIINFFDRTSFKSENSIKESCAKIANNYIKHLLENKSFDIICDICNEQKHVFQHIEVFSQNEICELINTKIPFKLLVISHEHTFRTLCDNYASFNQHGLISTVQKNKSLLDKTNAAKELKWEPQQYATFFTNLCKSIPVDEIKMPNFLQENLLDVLTNGLKYLLEQKKYDIIANIFNIQNLQKVIPVDLLAKMIQSQKIDMSSFIEYIISKPIVIAYKNLITSLNMTDEQRQLYSLMEILAKPLNQKNPDLSKIENEKILKKILEHFWTQKSSKYVCGNKLKAYQKIYEEIFKKFPQMKRELARSNVELLYQTINLTYLGDEKNFPDLNAAKTCNCYTFICAYGDEQQQIIKHLFYNQLSAIYLHFGINEGENRKYQHFQCYQFIKNIYNILADNNDSFLTEYNSPFDTFYEENFKNEKEEKEVGTKYDYTIFPKNETCLNKQEFRTHCAKEYCKLFGDTTTQPIYIINFAINAATSKKTELLQCMYSQICKIPQKINFWQKDHEHQLILNDFLKLIDDTLQPSMKEKFLYAKYDHKKAILKNLNFDADSFSPSFNYLAPTLLKLEKQEPLLYNKYLKEECANLASLIISKQLKTIRKRRWLDNEKFEILKKFLPEQHFIIKMSGDITNLFKNEKKDEKLCAWFEYFFSEWEKLKDLSNLEKLLPTIYYLTKINVFSKKKYSAQSNSINEIIAPSLPEKLSLAKEFCNLCQQTIRQFCTYIDSCEKPPSIAHCQNLLKLGTMCELQKPHSDLVKCIYTKIGSYLESWPKLIFSQKSSPKKFNFNFFGFNNMLPKLKTKEYQKLELSHTNEQDNFLYQVLVDKKILASSNPPTELASPIHKYILIQLIRKLDAYLTTKESQKIDNEISSIKKYIQDAKENQQLLLPDRLLHLIEKITTKWKTIGNREKTENKVFLARLPKLLDYCINLHALLSVLNTKQPGNYKSMKTALDNSIDAIVDRCYKTWRDMLTDNMENGALKKGYKKYVETKNFLVCFFKKTDYINSSEHKHKYSNIQKDYNTPHKKEESFPHFSPASFYSPQKPN